MAIMHRKLFPEPDSDQTTDCSDCAYGELYWPPQPPPLPSSSTINDDTTTTHISPYLIITVALIGCAVLLISYYLIMVRYCTRFRQPPATQVNEESQDFMNEDQGPEIDHPIWYITTVGFQPAVINSITVVKFKKGDGLIDGTDCSVCLTEFHHDESLRLLPKCNHAFHIPCIDTWLRSHTNCPLCRAAIFPTIANTISRPVHQNRNHGFGLNQNTQIENADDGDELGENRAGEVELSENSRETEVDFRQIEDEMKEDHDPKTETESVTALTRSTSIDSAAAIVLHESNSSNSAMDLQSSNHMRD